MENANRSPNTDIVLMKYDLIQPKIGKILTTKRVTIGKGSYTYSEIDAMLAQIEPVVKDFGCRIRFFKTPLSERSMILTTQLEDIESGQYINDQCVVPIFDDVKMTGGYCTYMQRYGLDHLFCLTYTDNPADRDGQTDPNVKIEAVNPAPKREFTPRVGHAISPKQQKWVEDLYKQMPSDKRASVIKHITEKYDVASGITEEKFQSIIKELNMIKAKFEGESK